MRTFIPARASNHSMLISAELFRRLFPQWFSLTDDSFAGQKEHIRVCCKLVQHDWRWLHIDSSHTFFFPSFSIPPRPECHLSRRVIDPGFSSYLFCFLPSAFSGSPYAAAGLSKVPLFLRASPKRIFYVRSLLLQSLGLFAPFFSAGRKPIYGPPVSRGKFFFGLYEGCRSVAPPRELVFLDRTKSPLSRLYNTPRHQPQVGFSPRARQDRGLRAGMPFISFSF